MRVLLTAGYVTPLAFPPAQEEAEPTEDDSDGDGLTDSADACPDAPEDRDQFEDEDGCPDLDNDNDGIPDEQDGAPLDPEDRDGFQDEDGIPEADNDGDGILDVDDAAPLDPEDPDGFQDEDGVPDLDNDNDSILDADDECPLEPGLAANDGCPRTIRVTGTRIEILQRVEFATNSDELLSRSFQILEEIRAVLEANAQIRHVRIEGHTDDRGSAEHNLDLSDRRAASVWRWLVEHGIDGGRLEAQGLGEERPITTNDTAEGRQQNRRVEFHLVNAAE